MKTRSHTIKTYIAAPSQPQTCQARQRRSFFVGIRLLGHTYFCEVILNHFHGMSQLIHALANSRFIFEMLYIWANKYKRMGYLSGFCSVVPFMIRFRGIEIE